MSAFNVRSSLINTLDRLSRTEVRPRVGGHDGPIASIERAVRASGIASAEGWIISRIVARPQTANSGSLPASARAPAAAMAGRGGRRRPLQRGRAAPATALLEPNIVDGRAWWLATPTRWV